MVRFLMVLIIGLVCAQPVPAQVAEEAEEVENAEELAVREALRILQDRFNVRDKFSLVGDVDFEYHYMPEKGTRRPEPWRTLCRTCRRLYGILSCCIRRRNSARF